MYIIHLEHSMERIGSDTRAYHFTYVHTISLTSSFVIVWLHIVL